MARDRWLALGGKPPPQHLTLGGNHYALDRVFKHDFWAVTSLYAGTAGRVVLKMHRRASFFGLPLLWIGHALAANEQRVFERLAGIAGVPKFVARPDRVSVVHEFVPARTHRRGAPMSHEFVARFKDLVDEVHSRNVACVDLEKPENLLMGDDDRPYLIDFQVSFYWPARWGGDLWPARLLRSRLQRADRFHCLKMIRRSAPLKLSEDELALSKSKPWYVRAHTALTRPLLKVRRAFLDRWRPEEGRNGAERGRVDRDSR